MTHKKNAEYIRRCRNKKEKEGLVKLPDKWIYPVDKLRIEQFISMATNETKVMLGK